MPRALPTPTTAGDIARDLGLVLRGNAETVIDSVSSLAAAEAGSITFYSDKKLAKLVDQAKASAVIAPADCALSPDIAHLVSPTPHSAFATLLTKLFVASPDEAGDSDDFYCHPTATISGVNVQYGCGIGQNSSIGAGSVLHRNVQIGRNVRIGRDCVFYPGTVVYDDVVIGDRCIFHSNAVIGADGFGFQPSPTGWLKVPQVGTVIIGNDVEIGANSAVDRGAIENTVIGDGVKIDNLVQIGHNVRIGAHTAIAGCAGVAGSAVIGSRCMIGGDAKIVGHIEVCDDVIVSAGTLVTDSISTPGRYTGVFPYGEHREWMRMAATLRRSTKKSKPTT